MNSPIKKKSALLNSQNMTQLMPPSQNQKRRSRNIPPNLNLPQNFSEEIVQQESQKSSNNLNPKKSCQMSEDPSSSGSPSPTKSQISNHSKRLQKVKPKKPRHGKKNLLESQEKLNADDVKSEDSNNSEEDYFDDDEEEKYNFFLEKQKDTLGKKNFFKLTMQDGFFLEKRNSLLTKMFTARF